MIVYVAKGERRGGDAGATFIPDLKIVLPLQHVFPNNSAKLQT